MAIDLNTVSSGYNISVINSNFQLLEDVLNNSLLWRTGSVAGETLMQRDLDMNGFSILNIGVDLDNPDSLLTLEVADARYYNVSGDVLEGEMDAGNNKIVSLGAPAAATDAARKQEVDEEAGYRTSADASLQAQIAEAAPIAAAERPIVQWHGQTLLNSVTVPANQNAFSIGPQIAIAPGQTVTLGENSYWNILGNVFEADELYNVTANNLTTSDGASTVGVATLAALPARMTAEENKVQSVALGGTGATTAAAARTALGAAASAGVTNGGNAATGAVGEYLEASSTAAAITSATVTNISSLSLAAGDWEVSGIVEYVLAAGASGALMRTGTSSTTAAFSGLGSDQLINTTLTAASTNRQSSGTIRWNLSATTTIYLVGQLNFTGGTATARGIIRARRIR